MLHLDLDGLVQRSPEAKVEQKNTVAWLKTAAAWGVGEGFKKNQAKGSKSLERGQCSPRNKGLMGSRD